MMVVVVVGDERGIVYNRAVACMVDTLALISPFCAASKSAPFGILSACTQISLSKIGKQMH